MKISKNKRICSLVLVLAMFLTSFTFTHSSIAEPISNDVKIVGGMVLSKTVEATENPDVYKITLGAYSTGEAYTIKTEISRPVDIVMVIDESGSMDYTFSGRTTRWEATQNAINKFVDNIVADAKKYNVNHRIAITTYAENSYIYIGNDSWRSSRVATSTVENTAQYVVTSGNSNSEYRSMANNGKLFTLVDGAYKAVRVSRAWQGGVITGYYQYTYTFSDGSTVVSNEGSTVPNLGGRTLYTYGTVSVVNAALQDVTDAKQLANIRSTIDYAISPGGGTYPSGAVDLANQIFEAHEDDYGKDDKRAKLVIYFTDGMPGDGDTFDTTEAAKALPLFKKLKDNDVDIYSVGVFSEANCTNPQTLPQNGGSNSTERNNNRANRFMFLASSYYPEATAMDSTGPIIGDYEDRPYYMSPQDVQALTDTFQVISSAIHTEYTEVVMTEKAMVKDVITPYFAGPTNVDDIDAYFVPCTGIDPNNDKLRTFSEDPADRIEPDGDLDIKLVSYNENAEEDAALVGETPNDTVIATNFNYKENWCGLDDGKPRGKKVVVEFYVTVREGFIGGNGVPTNQAISGLYDDEGRLLPDFDLPMPEPQDVSIKEFSIEVEAAAKHVYLYGDLTEEQLKTDSIINMYNAKGEIDAVLKLDEENYGLPEWRVNFIDVVATAPKAPLTDIIAPKTAYNIEATVSPTLAEGACTPKDDTSDDAYIYTYVPRITFKDTSIKRGTTPDYDNNVAKIEWVRQDDEGQWVTSDKMIGTAPKLEIQYTPAEAAIYDDSHVSVSKVLLDSNGDGTCDADVTSYCLFDHDTCTVDDCAFDSAKENFLVHVSDKSANIVITNTGDTVEATDTFVYTITSENDKSFKRTVVIKGTGTAVIIGVPVDKYTVTQDEAWSYHYTCKTNPQELELQGEPLEGRNNVFTFENTKGEAQNFREDWHYVKNTFTPAGVVATN